MGIYFIVLLILLIVIAYVVYQHGPALITGGLLSMGSTGSRSSSRGRSGGPSGPSVLDPIKSMHVYATVTPYLDAEPVLSTKVDTVAVVDGVTSHSYTATAGGVPNNLVLTTEKDGPATIYNYTYNINRKVDAGSVTAPAVVPFSFTIYRRSDGKFIPQADGALEFRHLHDDVNMQPAPTTSALQSQQQPQQQPPKYTLKHFLTLADLADPTGGLSKVLTSDHADASYIMMPPDESYTSLSFRYGSAGQKKLFSIMTQLMPKGTASDPVATISIRYGDRAEKITLPSKDSLPKKTFFGPKVASYLKTVGDYTNFIVQKLVPKIKEIEKEDPNAAEQIVTGVTIPLRKISEKYPEILGVFQQAYKGTLDKKIINGMIG